MPRVHGNGFIQLDLTETSRLNVWGDGRIPRQKVPTPIHDHAFGFKSTILVGRLVNVVYGATYNEDRKGKFKPYHSKTREGEDTILVPYGEPVSIIAMRTDHLQWGTANNFYYMRAYEMHETFCSEPSATIMQKNDGLPGKIPASVLVPVGMEPDNEFNRYAHDEDMLWRIVEQTLKRRTA